MAAAKYQSFDEKKKKFAPILETAFLDPSTRKRITPLALRTCNGGFPWPFADASIDYIKMSPSFQYDTWYSKNYKMFIDILTGKQAANKEDKPMLECLFDYVLYGEHHMECLRTLETNSKLTKSEVAAMFALHYFKPLVPSCSYVIDKGSQGRIDECEICKEEIKYGDTSFGNCKVWHGCADIFMNTSVIKISLLSDMENLSLKDLDDTESLLCEEEKDSLACGDVCQDDDDLNNYGSDIVAKNIKKKAKAPALAQAITNAFCESNKNTALFNQFIPSFLVTETCIRIIQYNCEKDVLLMSDELPIWNPNVNDLQVDISTAMRVWLALNYSCKIDQTSERYNYMMEHTVKSDFKKLVGASYSVYIKEIERPLQLGKKYKYFKPGLDLEALRLDRDCYFEFCDYFK